MTTPGQNPKPPASPPGVPSAAAEGNPATGNPTAKRRSIWRRLLVVLILLAAVGGVGYWQRFNLLVVATYPLVLDESPASVSAILPTDAGISFRVAGEWVKGTRAETLLLHSPRPDRLTRMDLRPGLRDQFTRATVAYRIPRHVYEDFTDFAVFTPEDFYRELGKWMDAHPDQTVAIIVPRFRTRVSSMISRQLLSKDHRKRVFFVPADSALFDAGRWWEKKDGIRTVVDGWLRLTAYVLRGGTPPVPMERTDADFIAAAIGDQAQRQPEENANGLEGASP